MMPLRKRTATATPVAFSAFVIGLGLCLFVPLLDYTLEPPIGDFIGEWASTLLFSLAALMLLFTLPRRQPLNPTLLLAPLTLAAILGVHVALGSFVYDYDWMIWLGYLLVLVLAMLVGQALRGSGQTQETLSRLAWTLIITAVVNFVIQLLQVTGRDLDFFPYVVPLLERSACRIYGNVGQANQASMLAWLAIGAVLYLAGIRRLAKSLAIALLIVLLIGSALAASRMSWIFLGVLVALILGCRAWPAEGRASRGYLALTLIVGSVLADFAARELLAVMRTECASGLQRMGEVGEAGFVIRAELWKLALLIWKTSPWIGTGAGSFLGKLYELAPLNQHQPFDAYAHNSALQILAEFGLIGAGTVAALGLVWMWTLIKRRASLEAGDALMLAWVGVICAYSMLEFPLWYVHLLLLFGLLLGMLIRPEWSGSSVVISVRTAVAGIALACLAGGGLLLRDYLPLQRLYGAVVMKSDMRLASTPEIVAKLRELADEVVIYRPYADHLMSLIVPLNKEDLKGKIDDSERLLRRVPQSTTIAQRATLAVLAGDIETARSHIRRLYVFWPAVADEIEAEMRAIVDRQPVELQPLREIFEEEKARAPKPRW